MGNNQVCTSLGVLIVPDEPNTADEPLGFRKPPRNSFSINSVRNNKTYLADIFILILQEILKH